MPLIVFDTKGIPATRRERIEAAVIAGGKHVAASYEAWISADTSQGVVKVLITGPHGFERTVACTLDEGPAGIAECIVRFRQACTTSNYPDTLGRRATPWPHN